MSPKEEVFERSASSLFRNGRVRVVRVVDPKRQTLTYVMFPEAAISTVVVSNQRIPLK